jgi:hypothetical protein
MLFRLKYAKLPLPPPSSSRFVADVIIGTKFVGMEKKVFGFGFWSQSNADPGLKHKKLHSFKTLKRIWQLKAPCGRCRCAIHNSKFIHIVYE